MKRIAMACAAVTMLTACQTKSISEMSYTEVMALADEIIARCEAQGVGAGTPQMKACTDQETTREITTRYRNRQSQIAFAEALGEAGENMNRNRLSCTSTGIGNTVTTNCY